MRLISDVGGALHDNCDHHNADTCVFGNVLI